MKRPDDCTNRLLAAARDLFAKRGYDAVSVRDLTARARANLGAVTYHFGSKEALYHAAIATLTEPLAELVEQTLTAPGAPLDRIETLVRAVLTHFAARPGAPTILLRELATDRPLPPPITTVMQRNIGNLARTIVEGQRDGSIRAGDPVLLAFSAVAQPFYVAIASRLMREVAGRTGPAHWAGIVDHVATSVRHTLAHRSPAVA